MRPLLFLIALVLCSCDDNTKPSAKIEAKDESWGFVREYTDPRTSVRYLVFLRSTSLFVIPAPLPVEK